jgi:hypothetical protein
MCAKIHVLRMSGAANARIGVLLGMKNSPLRLKFEAR